MSDGLFANAGVKLKQIAVVFFVVVILAAVLLGVFTLINNSEMFLYTLVIIAVVVFMAFVVGLVISAFGDLVESNAEMLKIMKEQHSGFNSKATENKTATAVTESEPRLDQELPAGGWRCSCGRVNYPYITTCACGKNKWAVVKDN